MSAFYDLSQTPRNILNQAIVSAIVSENNGALFDPSDMSTLYQDAAGTTPVTAVEQPVGLMLDKAQGGMLGPELVSNGSFDADTGWTKGAGWLISGGVATKAQTGTITNINQYISGLKSDTFYIVTLNITRLSGEYVRVELPSVQFVSIYGTGLVTCILKASTSVGSLYIYGDANFSGSIDNISVREIYGYHATQRITAYRPTLSARKNLLVATETLSTQSVTTLAAKYCLSFWGTGSITLSGTSSVVLQGTGAGNRVWVEFTPTAGTLTLTVAGTVSKAQLELTS